MDRPRADAPDDEKRGRSPPTSVRCCRLLAPLIIWLVFKDRSRRSSDRHAAKEALNIQISLLIYTLVVGVFSILLSSSGCHLDAAASSPVAVLVILIGDRQGRQRRGLPLPAEHPLPAVITSRSRTTASASSRPSWSARIGSAALDEPGRPGRGTSVRPASSSTVERSPSARRISSSTRSTCRVSASSVSGACAGLTPAPRRAAYGGRVLDVPPAHTADVGVRPGPAPHQSPPVQ